MAPAKESVGKDPERYKLVERGTIFYNPMRILLGSIALLDEGHEPGITSPDYVVFKTKLEFIYPRWLYYWLRSADGAAFIRTLTRGAVRERMLFRRLAAAEIEVPPYESQLNFARAVLSVERAHAATEAQLEAAKALPAAYLRAVFTSPDAQTWPMIKVSQLCDSIEYGFTASANFEVSEPRFLRITDIQDGRVEWETVPGCGISSEEESRYRLMDGDIVFARTGATTGKSYLMRNPPRAVFASYLIRIRPSPAVMAEYLYAFFQSDGYWQQIRASMRGGAQPHVNATLLGTLTLPLAPLSEQQRIVARLSGEMATAEKTRRALEEQLAAINALPAALLRRAFSGGL